MLLVSVPWTSWKLHVAVGQTLGTFVNNVGVYFFKRQNTPNPKQPKKQPLRHVKLNQNMVRFATTLMRLHVFVAASSAKPLCNKQFESSERTEEE